MIEPKATRVLINSDGEAVSPTSAAQRHIAIDFMFVRNDGWVLGAPKRLKEVAMSLWRSSWTEIWQKTTTGWVRSWPLAE